MPLQINLDVHKMFDGKLLPVSRDKEHDGVLFYNVVVRQKCRDILRVPFVLETKRILGLHFYKPNVSIPNKFVGMFNHVRLISDDDPLEFHIYKFSRRGRELGMERMIGSYSTSQDDVVYTIDLKTTQPISNSFLSGSWAPASKKDIFKFINCLDIYADHPSSSPIWRTQRDFYSRMHDSMNMELQRLNCEKTVKFLEDNKSFDSLLDFVVQWGKTMKPCKYVPDTLWFDKHNSDDKGDAAIESTKAGDCEDFAHYYCRMFYLLIYLADCVPNINRPTKQYCNLLKNYLPFVYICRIKQQNGSYDYHSTMLIIPRQRLPSNPVISFEVTNNDDHFIIKKGSKFFEWHVEHYFLVDRYHIARFEKNDDLTKLNIDELYTRFFNY